MKLIVPDNGIGRPAMFDLPLRSRSVPGRTPFLLNSGKRWATTGGSRSTVHDTHLASARSLFYPKRTYGAIVSAAGDVIDDEVRKRFLMDFFE